jgi:hypothetical protein
MLTSFWNTVHKYFAISKPDRQTVIVLLAANRRQHRGTRPSLFFFSMHVVFACLILLSIHVFDNCSDWVTNLTEWVKNLFPFIVHCCVLEVMGHMTCTVQGKTNKPEVCQLVTKFSTLTLPGHLLLCSNYLAVDPHFHTCISGFKPLISARDGLSWQSFSCFSSVAPDSSGYCLKSGNDRFHPY